MCLGCFYLSEMKMMLVLKGKDFFPVFIWKVTFTLPSVPCEQPGVVAAAPGAGWDSKKQHGTLAAPSTQTTMSRGLLENENIR